MGDRKRLLITGGAGFIGSALVDLLLEHGNDVVILDALSWGANLKNLPPDLKVVGGLSGQMTDEIPKGRCVLVVGDVADARLVRKVVDQVDGVYHLAAQTHVDRSYGDVLPFVNSNVVGSYSMLEAIRSSKYKVRCVFVSTDEVYGDVQEGAFKEEAAAMAPRNIYSTLKAGGDLLAQAYSEIFNLDIVIARPANNYGPRQFEEKLIPKILTYFSGRNVPSKKIPIWGDGSQIRDWLYVRDTVRGLEALYERGKSGQAYNLGAHEFRTVVEVVKAIAEMIGRNWEEHIEHLPDRIRGDRRYALDLSKTEKDIGWKATTKFEAGLEETVRWYLR